jgi:hypothetical protein
MKLYLKVFIVVILFTFGACSSSSEDIAKQQHIADSIAKAEADATEQEAIIAERMIDSANAVANDTTKH